MARVVHFEILVDDINRASKFYNNIFGWGISNWGGQMPYYLITTGPSETPGINGALMPRGRPFEGKEGFRSFVCTIEMDNLEETAVKIEQNGGTRLTPRSEIPGIGFFSYFTDTENNVFGVMQPQSQSNKQPQNQSPTTPPKNPS
jgi:hypothetical protein